MGGPVPPLRLLYPSVQWKLRLWRACNQYLAHELHDDMVEKWLKADIEIMLPADAQAAAKVCRGGPDVGKGPAIRGICRGVGALAGVANEVVELQRLDPPPQTPPRVPRHRYLQKQRVRACVSVRVRVRA